MAIETTDLTTISADDVAREQANLSQMLAEAFPAVDFRGAVGTLVLHLMSTLTAGERRNFNRLRLAGSLDQIAADPTLADPGVVDSLLSNFRVTRRPGAAAAGQVTVVLTSLIPTVIPGGSTFAANGTTFVVPGSIAARVDPSQVTSDSDRVISAIGGGRYAFSVPAVAVDPGPAGMIRRGAAMTPLFSIRLLDSCYAEGDFSGGFSEETNAELLARFQAGVAAPAWSNRVTIDAMIRNQAAFARIMHTSVVGAGDPEMVRDKHSILPLATFGRCDCYVKTAALPASIGLTRLATLVETTPAGGVWQFSLGRDDAPGFYEVERVALPTAPQSEAGYEIVADVRGFDLSGGGFLPDVVDAAEAAYSRYSTATIRFLDPDTPCAALQANASSASYAVAVRAMPLVAELQDFLGGRGVRGPGGDVLAKAPIPCFLSVHFDVLLPAGVAAPDVAPLASALAAAVAAPRFPGQLHAVSLAATIQPLLPAGATIGGFDMAGRIRRPDGTTLRIRDDDVLLVPDEAGSMVSGRTVAFLLDPADVGISLATTASPEI